MASIDDRVVEMKFRRDDFLKGTEETLNALNRLDKSLAGASGMSKSLDNIERMFSGVGAIATGALMKIGGMAATAGKSLMDNIMQPLFEGGKKRALNLEQANFQLKGIMDGAVEITNKTGAVDNIMKNVSAAVDGTAYSLDAAASAAAQFAATGMYGGLEMQNALRGISGVAAMAGSSYEDVSSIFTKVAGQGRLMGDDLNRLASRGINAAATLGKSMGKTEAEVRDMVTKGEISFTTFASAMNAAFGDHATKANETYAGSLSNLKSAFARIGAEYFIIEHEKMRRIFNALRPAVNAFNKALDPLWVMYKNLVAIPMAEEMEAFGASLAAFDFTKITNVLIELFNIALSVKEVFLSWIKPIGDAFSVVFASDDGSSWLVSLAEWLAKFNQGVRGLAATEDQATSVRDFFVKVFEVVKKFTDFMSDQFAKIGPIAEKVWGIIKVGLDWVKQGFEFLEPYVKQVFDYFFGIEAPLGKFFDKFQRDVEETGSVFITLGDYAKRFYNQYLEPVVEALMRFGKVIDNVVNNGLSGLADGLVWAFEPLKGAWEWLKGASQTAKTLFDNLLNPVGKIKAEIPSVSDWLSSVITWLSEKLGGLQPQITNVFKIIGDSLTDFTATLSEAFSGVSLDQIIEVGEVLGRFAVILMAWDTLKSVKGTFDSISGFFGSLTTAVQSFTKQAEMAAKGNLFLTVAIALGVIAGSLWVLAQIDPGRLQGAVSALAILSGVIVGLMVALSFVNAAALMQAGKGLLFLGFAISGIVIAMVILALIPFEILIKGMLILMALLAILTVTAAVLSKYAPQMQQAGLGILAMAGALTLLIIPIAILGMMDPAALGQGLVAIALALLLLTAAATVIANGGKAMILGAAALAIMVGAITLLVIPLYILAGMDFGALIGAITIVALALLLLVAAATGAQGVMAGAIAIVVLTGAMLLMAAAVMVLAQIPFGAGVLGLILLAGAMAIMLVAAAAAAAVLPGVLALAALVIAFGLAALMMGAGLMMAAAAVALVANLLPTLAAGILMLISTTPLIAAFSPFMLIAAAAMLVFSVALLALAVAAGVAGIALMLLGVGLMLMGVGFALIGATGEKGAKALAAIMPVLLPIVRESLKIGALALALTGLGAALLVFGVGALAAGAGSLILGIGVVVLSVGLLAMLGVAALAPSVLQYLVEAMGKLSGVAPHIQKFEEATIKFNGALTNMSTEADKGRIATQQLNQELRKSVAGFSTMGSDAQTAGMMLDVGLRAIATSVKNSGPAITAGGRTIVVAITTLATGITNTSPRIQTAINTMISMMVLQIIIGATVVGQASNKIVESLAKMSIGISLIGMSASISTRLLVVSISRELQGGASKVASIVVMYAAALAALPNVIAANRSRSTSAAKTLVSGITAEINNGRTRTYNAALSVGTAIVDGMVNGMRNGSVRVSNQANRMAKTALDTAKNTLEVRSPSRKMYEVGQFYVVGFINAIADGTKKATKSTEELALSVMDGMSSALASSAEEINGFDFMQFSPTITPVLDLDAMRQQATALNGLAGPALDVSTSIDQSTALAQLEEALTGAKTKSEEENRGKAQFVQNNYSPKALSAAEIYRQSKNLIAMA